MFGGRASCADDEVFLDYVAFGGLVRAEVVAVGFLQHVHGMFVTSHEFAEGIEIGVGVRGVG